MLKYIKIFSVIALSCYNVACADELYLFTAEELYQIYRPLKIKLSNEIAEAKSQVWFATDDETRSYWSGKDKAFREVADWIYATELGYNLD